MSSARLRREALFTLILNSEPDLHNMPSKRNTPSDAAQGNYHPKSRPNAEDDQETILYNNDDQISAQTDSADYGDDPEGESEVDRTDDDQHQDPDGSDDDTQEDDDTSEDLPIPTDVMRQVTMAYEQIMGKQKRQAYVRKRKTVPNVPDDRVPTDIRPFADF